MRTAILSQPITDVVIIGAGPYGLSVAAHLRARGVRFQIFGRPMHNWAAHMPKGMLLKSDGFASNLSDPDGDFTLRAFCDTHNLEYADLTKPVSLETFVTYGRAFQHRFVSEADPREVVNVVRSADAYLVRLDDGELVSARQVVIAVGITYFPSTPQTLRHLPAEFASHSFDHHDLEGFRGRRVTVLGGGASAIDLAGLLADVGSAVQLVARQSVLKFHGAPPMDGARTRWQRVRHPQSGIGPGLRARLFTDAPGLFRYLPDGARLRTIRNFLGPAGGWFAKEKVMGRVPLLLGYRLVRAEYGNGTVQLQLRAIDGEKRIVEADHVIAATGYRPDIARLPFLSEVIRSQIRTIEQSPVLSAKFESSVPGLFFVGLAAASSFGPVMRFAFGADFTARRIASALANRLPRQRAISLVRVGA